MHGTGDSYEIYQGALIGGQGPISKPLFPLSCIGGTELTRGWKVYEPSENPTASMSDSIYAVRWSRFLSASAEGVYTFFADLPTANSNGSTTHGTLRLSSQCVNEGHAEFASLDSEVSLTSTFISLNPTNVTRMRIVVGNYVEKQ
jgi:hypothetical protein